jgi:hypothetical protein
MSWCRLVVDSSDYRTVVTISPKPGDRPLAQLRVHAHLRPPLAGDVLVTASVGASGEAITLWANPDDRQALLTPSGLAESCARRPVAARVVIQTASTAAVAPIAALDVPFCLIQPLPDGRILVVGARGGAAVVFNADGEPVRRCSVGDGIEHVLTTPSGRVWIGYFDEGVYGGDPVTQRGIVRFNADLEPEWKFPYDAGLGPVDDCYSLNVDAETAWSCYYSSFPIVRISDRTVTGWRNSIHGATALITDAGTCALIGGYRDQRRRVVVGRLAEGQFDPTGDRLLAFPDRQHVDGKVRMVGRGPELHVFAETIWYRLSLDDLI